MPRRFDLLVFDWDGTLMDSASSIALCLQAACRDLGFKVPSDRDARYVIGLGLRDAMAYILPELPIAEYSKVTERYRHHFIQHDAVTTLFCGAQDMLRELRTAGHLLAIATGKSRRGLDRALAQTGLTDCFDETRCADEGHTKPDPGMLHRILEKLHVAPERALMIGDTTHDMAMARAAGMQRLAVRHGAHEERELLDYEPLACLADCGELRTWLAEHA
jgi:phosphoglycolate phosphatase